jgi:hypothetical protein
LIKYTFFGLSVSGFVLPGTRCRMMHHLCQLQSPQWSLMLAVPMCDHLTLLHGMAGSSCLSSHGLFSPAAAHCATVRQPQPPAHITATAAHGLDLACPSSFFTTVLICYICTSVWALAQGLKVISRAFYALPDCGRAVHNPVAARPLWNCI